MNKILPAHTNDLGEGMYEDAIVLFRGVGTELSIKVGGLTLTVPSDQIVVGIQSRDAK